MGLVPDGFLVFIFVTFCILVVALNEPSCSETHKKKNEVVAVRQIRGDERWAVTIWATSEFAVVLSYLGGMYSDGRVRDAAPLRGKMLMNGGAPHECRAVEFLLRLVNFRLSKPRGVEGGAA